MLGCRQEDEGGQEMGLRPGAEQAPLWSKLLPSALKHSPPKQARKEAAKRVQLPAAGKGIQQLSTFSLQEIWDKPSPKDEEQEQPTALPATSFEICGLTPPRWVPEAQSPRTPGEVLHLL